MQASPASRARTPVGVPLGPRAYRARVRAGGPLMALVPPAVMGVVALVLLGGSHSTGRGVAGFALAVLAAPGLLVTGAPLRAGAAPVLLAIAVSAVLWLVVGAIAARRATRRPAVSWRDFWVEWALPFVGVEVGVVAGLVATQVVLGGAVL